MMVLYPYQVTAGWPSAPDALVAISGQCRFSRPLEECLEPQRGSGREPQWSIFPVCRPMAVAWFSYLTARGTAMSGRKICGQAPNELSPPQPQQKCVRSADGVNVAFTRWSYQKAVMFVIPFEGGVETRLCDDCGVVMHWMSNNRRIVYWNDKPIRFWREPREGADDFPPRVRRSRGKVFRRRQMGGISSGDGPGQRTRVHRASSRWARGSGERVDSDRGLNWEAIWSPDGNLVYGIGQQEGYSCIGPAGPLRVRNGLLGTPFLSNISIVLAVPLIPIRSGIEWRRIACISQCMRQ